jgi:outer membrane immunogenic protein
MKKRATIALLAASLTAATSFAADYPVTPRLTPAYPVGPLLPVEWTGFYFGVNAGYGFAQGTTDTNFSGGIARGQLQPDGTTTTLFTTTPLGAGPNELGATRLLGSGNLSGAIAGGQVGFNWQAGMLVFGAEFDAQWSGQKGSFAVACTTGCTATQNITITSLMTGRARVGLAFDWIMPYVTAGGVVVNIDDDLTVTKGGVTGHFNELSDSSFGWTVGAGVDIALSSNWSARFEYLYIKAGDHSTPFAFIPNPLGVGSVNDGGSYQDNIVRVGLNYRFGPRGGPGVLERQRPAPAAYASAYDFLPSLAMFADKARSEKRPQAAPVVAETAAPAPAPARAAAASPAEPKAAAPARVEVATAGELPAMPAAVRAEPRPAMAAAIAAEPRPAKSPYKNFADIDDADLNDGVSAAPKAITLPSKKQRQNVENESQRLNRIMSICSGC